MAHQAGAEKVPDIFLSYSREDQATAHRFAEAFERAGFTVWWDQTLRSGENYDQVTEKALREAKAVVVLWSKTAVESRWVRAEATQADRLGTLVPAMIEDCTRPIMFELKHTAELAHWKGNAEDSAWRAFVSDLKRFTPNKQADAGATPTSTDIDVAPRMASGRRAIWIAVPVVVAVAIAAGIWGGQRLAGAQRARQQIIPAIAKLVDAGDFSQAFAKAKEARRFAADDPLLNSLTPLFTARYSITSTPAGAEAYVRRYDTVSDAWQLLGRTPLANVELPRTALRWRFEKEGFATAERANSALALQNGGASSLQMEVGKLDVELKAAAEQPADMVYVPGGPALQIGGSNPIANLPPYFIQRTEVTNAQYKEFIEAGGYERPSFWEGIEIRKAGKPVAFKEAMRQFVDATGRPGPATWEIGNYPEGRGQYPVTGISWYEAAAYAHFRGRSLPTYYHWLRAALPDDEIPASLAASIAPLSNFGTSGAAPVGKFQGVGLYGTYDLFGNAREWLSNPGPQGGWVIGGSWEDPTYNYSLAVPVAKFERSPLNGFRLIQNIGEVPDQDKLEAALNLNLNVYSAASFKPVSDEVYADYRRQLSYESGELHASAPISIATTEEWIKQRVTIDAGYNGERLDVILFVPRHAKPPFQPVILFSGGQVVFFPDKSENIEPGFAAIPLDYVVKSGRMLVQPIFQGTYERFKSPYNSRDRVRTQREWIERRWDLGRTLDYLATRSDVDPAHIGYIGLSFGASAAMPLVAVEPRLKAAVLISGGMPPPGGALSTDVPFMDPASHALRIRIPVLMINGRYDAIFPVEAAQVPYFKLLGSPPTDKRHVVLDFGHGSPPRAETLRETLDWFDKYLGEVRH
ncbi:MAG: SUMF1/EgtB/PvdO family nonheme iron enzyme [Pseudomonadota bacterium]